MATLAAQLKTDYEALVVEPHYPDQELTRISELAAARTKRYAGAVDGTDDEAVDLGLRYMTLLVTKKFQLASDDAARADEQAWLQDAMEMREQRAQEAAMPVVSEDEDDE